MIIIDGQQSKLEISNFANLEEILVNVMQEQSMENRVVTDVLVNEETFSEIYPHQAEDIGSESIKSVEIRSVPVGEMAVNISREMYKVADIMATGSRQISRLFRQAEDAEALELLQDLLDVTRDFMSTVGVLRSEFVDVSDPQFSTLVERVSELLGEMGDVLNSEDWVLLADLLEFEFNPVCEAWNKNLEALRADIARSLD